MEVFEELDMTVNDSDCDKQKDSLQSNLVFMYLIVEFQKKIA